MCDGIGHKLLGNVSSTYAVVPARNGSRLVLKLVAIPPRDGLLGAAYRRVPLYAPGGIRTRAARLKRVSIAHSRLP